MVNRCDFQSSPDVQRRISRTSDECYESYEDEVEDFEEKGVCYDNVGQDVVEDGVVGASPNFEVIKVVGSSNVHFGNKTYFQGPVTVLKQTIVSPSEVEKTKLDLQSNGLNPTTQTHTQAAIQTSTTEKVRLTLCSGSKKHRVFIVGGGVVAILIVFLIYLSGQIKTGQTDKTPSTTNLGETGDGTVSDVFLTPLNESATFLDGKTLRIRERSEWLAQPPVAKTSNLKTPVPFVIITHSASEGCHTSAECIVRVRTIQQFHIESKGWSDIGYNFLVGGDGAVYAGRGWDKEGAFSLGWNYKSIGICVVGTFTTIEPASKQLASTQKLIARGVALGKIAEDYKLLAHNQTQSTESPGRLVFAVIKNWPHWYNSTKQLISSGS